MFETLLPRHASNDCERLSRRYLDIQENQRMHSLWATVVDARRERCTRFLNKAIDNKS